MAHIVEFAVEGLAGRKQTYAQKLNRDVNVFFGLNGSGKTSLLKILHSAMTGNTLPIGNTPFRAAEVKVYSIDHDSVFTYSIERENIPARKRGKAVQSKARSSTKAAMDEELLRLKGVAVNDDGPKWEVLPDKGQTNRYSHRYLPTSRLWVTSDALSLNHGVMYRYESGSESEEQLDIQFQQFIERLWQRYMGEILGKVRKAQEDGLANILKEVLATKQRKLKGQALETATAYKRVKAFLIRQGSPGVLGPMSAFEKRYSNSALLKNVVSHIDNVEIGIEEAVFPRDKLQDLIGRMFTGNKKITFTDRSISIQTEEQLEIGIASLSSGEKQALLILIETLYADANTIMVDEPEISMHIDWQKELIPSMQSVNPMSQLILATHSPEIMAAIDDDKIFRL